MNTIPWYVLLSAGLLAGIILIGIVSAIVDVIYWFTDLRKKGKIK